MRQVLAGVVTQFLSILPVVFVGSRYKFRHPGTMVSHQGVSRMSSPEIPVEDSSPTGELRIPGSTERYADWVARMERGRGRQAAISRNLGSLTNYRNWAEKVRGTWDADVPPPAVRGKK
jgi:hypothetical protein